MAHRRRVLISLGLVGVVASVASACSGNDHSRVGTGGSTTTASISVGNASATAASATVATTARTPASSADSSASPGPTSLSIVRACVSAEVWVVSIDDTIAVGVVVHADHRSTTVPTTFTLTRSDLMAYRGTTLAEQFCAGTGAPNAEPVTIASGSGSLTLDPIGPGPVNGEFSTTALILGDGTVIAPIDAAASCIGCFPT